LKKGVSRFLRKAYRFGKDMAKPFAYIFFAAQEYYLRKHPDKEKLPVTVIGEGSKIHPRAFIAKQGVVIGRNCLIEADAVILEHTILEDNVRVMQGSVIGSDGFVRLKVGKHIISRHSRGKLIIRSGAIIGPHCCVDRAFWRSNTVVGNHSVLGSNIYVAHDVYIGDKCIIFTGAMLAGRAKVDDEATVGFNCSVSNDLIIGKRAIVFPGSVVTKDVPPGAMVSGNFAINHSKHMLILREIASQSVGIL